MGNGEEWIVRTKTVSKRRKPGGAITQLLPPRASAGLQQKRSRALPGLPQPLLEKGRGTSGVFLLLSIYPRKPKEQDT